MMKWAKNRMPNEQQLQEIELKLMLEPEQVSSLKAAINQLAGTNQGQEKLLVNRYFDTPNLALRQLEMGLRVRGCNGALEQTIKTAGQVIGGLHSRPEYNVTIHDEQPQLALFPAEIWPAGTDISQLQQALSCLFSTDFQRTTWLIQQQHAQVEVAFDQGDIRAGAQQTPICEVEFELFSGEASALLTLAMQVARAVPVRLGRASKAQRGYRLAGQQTLAAPKAPQFEQLTVASLLAEWQTLEEAIFAFADDTGKSQQYWLWLAELLAQLPRVLQQDALDEAIAEQSLWLIGELQVDSELTAAARLKLLQQQLYYGQLQLRLLALVLAA
ncbi:CYTH domain-containing protein [Shewanella sp. C32]|uniref:CYTH domain-containing protein n=1 Tax=Shewanella electrica TaxID=515560 RepID=A0ABT2FIM0_9GAMM|nr:CYTH domain-containing protein [Shewanella electrica]MCH1923939.1 CYTH domain-containing protein [Shewanella electrica]MCS4555842.1 CYTH domain-containing protein [Shewanella electrica]